MNILYRGEIVNQTYTVKRGDTLYGISNQFGVSVTELAELNGIKGDNLQIGEVLKIPGSSGENPNNMFMYTVKTGDTLYSIAKKYNTTVQKIIDLNYCPYCIDINDSGRFIAIGTKEGVIIFISVGEEKYYNSMFYCEPVLYGGHYDIIHSLKFTHDSSKLFS